MAKDDIGSASGGYDGRDRRQPERQNIAKEYESSPTADVVTLNTTTAQSVCGLSTTPNWE